MNAEDDPTRASLGVLWQGETLLTMRNPKHGLWTLPGGRAKLGESNIDALARELHEEIGSRLTRATHLFSTFGTFSPETWISVFAVEVVGRPAPAEGHPIAWLEPEAFARQSPEMWAFWESRLPIMRAFQKDCTWREAGT